MRKLKIFLSAAIVLAALTQLHAQQKMSLNEAIQLALHQNTSIIKSQNNIDTYRAGLKSAYGNLLPTLNIGTGFNWNRVSDNGGTQINYFGVEQQIPPSQTDNRSYSFSVNGNVTLFDGLSNYANIDQRKNNLQSAKLDLDKLKQDVILQTVTLYTAIISAQKLLTFQEADLKYNQDLLDKTKDMFNLKMVPISNLYSQKVQTANSELALLQAQNNFEKAKLNLLKYLSVDINKNYTYQMDTTQFIDTSVVNNNLQSLYSTALNNRKDYVSQKFKLESAQNQLTMANAGLFPSLNGNYGFSTNAVKPGKLFDRRVYSAGLSLSIPIFSHWNTENSIQTAKVQFENTTEDLNALERQVKIDVKNAVLDMQTAQKQLNVTEDAVKSAEESWKVLKEKYTIGASTYLDLQQTYRDYLQAQYNRIDKEQNYVIKQYQLLNALGESDK